MKKNKYLSPNRWISLPHLDLDCVAQYHEWNRLASFIFEWDGLTPKPAATRISQVDLLSHHLSSSAFFLTSSEKICISSKAAFNKVPGFLETSSPLSPPSTLVALAPSCDWFVFFSLHLEWGFHVSVSDSMSDDPECDFGSGEDGRRNKWSPLK